MENLRMLIFFIALNILINNQMFSQNFSKSDAGSLTLSEGSNTEIFLSDMSQCIPENAMSWKIEKDKWQLIDYETVDGLKGTMVFCQPEDKCGELRLPLGIEGVYNIF